MQAAARGETGSALEVGYVLAGEPLIVASEFAEVVEFSATPWGFESSFFHIGHLDIENGIFEAALRRAGCEPRLRSVNIVHDLAAVNKNSG